MKRPINRFEVRPTPAEIKEVAEYHEAFQEDYCKVWLADGSKRIFKNDMPIVNYYSGGQGSYYYIEFVNKHLYGEGRFGRLGIIRSKRIIKGVLEYGN
jgi:hypothetical protein